MAGRCQFHSSGAGRLHDVHQVEVRAGASFSLWTHGLCPGATALSWPQCLCCVLPRIQRGAGRPLSPSAWTHSSPRVHLSSLCGF